MFPKFANPYWLAILVILTVATGTVASRFAFFFAPFWWTGEPARLAEVAVSTPPSSIQALGPGKSRARGSVTNVSVVTAAETETRLPAGCCEAVYMRAVFHHIANHEQFASDVARALRPGGRIAVIDFAPGSLWFHGSDHGVEPDSVVFEPTGNLG